MIVERNEESSRFPAFTGLLAPWEVRGVMYYCSFQVSSISWHYYRRSCQVRFFSLRNPVSVSPCLSCILNSSNSECHLSLHRCPTCHAPLACWPSTCHLFFLQYRYAKEMQAAEGKLCRRKSKTFSGYCFISEHCDEECKEKEGAKRGMCIKKSIFRRYCYCYHTCK
ncbi:uncharacterized protein [Nicotiana tomentosiformis]|uniref:uncharacterized protein isoform X2 n=1 Tax=Nicotiana tomentosiformis TaxID=4098 RepID=UPI00388C3A20